MQRDFFCPHRRKSVSFQAVGCLGKGLKNRGCVTKTPENASGVKRTAVTRVRASHRERAGEMLGKYLRGLKTGSDLLFFPGKGPQETAPALPSSNRTAGQGRPAWTPWPPLPPSTARHFPPARTAGAAPIATPLRRGRRSERRGEERGASPISAGETAPPAAFSPRPSLRTGPGLAASQRRRSRLGREGDAPRGGCARAVRPSSVVLSVC